MESRTSIKNEQKTASDRKLKSAQAASVSVFSRTFSSSLALAIKQKPASGATEFAFILTVTTEIPPLELPAAETEIAAHFHPLVEQYWHLPLPHQSNVQ